MEVLGKIDFFELINSRLADYQSESALIFIHGFNVSFEDAARRSGQIAVDLGFNGVTAMYSWPSQGDLKKYKVDESNIEWCQPHLEEFLSDFAKNSNIKRIYVIAHSMGNRALVKAYTSALNNDKSIRSIFKEIILAAPDIDAEVFTRDLLPAMAVHRNPVTLYASSNDKALKISKAINGYPRAGDSDESIVIVSGLETIDSSEVNTSWLGHSNYADERTLISDMYSLINNGLRPDKRHGLEIFSNTKGLYWKFKA
ncbi:alpha/beta hydrolase [Alteromonas sp. 1_MG-2023]|uniref:alpha/beta hydrolase n=1 Tax=Alteromonas sp. 1_MG-2023 TaxID=3062669 RepID=UPI0026E189AE|nr:alpha/beta hydrolase [Alteromonas sp. 1_MG-2023]MDO6477351.1 alpha/beta hydrolase [Alteromonas sp. 1_MG-2023]